jgi:hypothetical protein
MAGEGSVPHGPAEVATAAPGSKTWAAGVVASHVLSVASSAGNTSWSEGNAEAAPQVLSGTKRIISKLEGTKERKKERKKER